VDWILLDVPCTGSGVIRKNPDLKWKFSTEWLHEMMKVQELILQDSLNYLRDDQSKIVYSTCSVFNEENLMQVMKFCEKYNFEIENQSHFSTLP
jgi:16S rRNA (cytosine967-C5)-methyltransferase